jgi:ribose 5-phosphate isomerase B
MKIYIGADHNGFALKATMVQYLQRQGHKVQDTGDAENNPQDDFPQFAERLVTALKAEPGEAKGILICGSGQGMCMAANRYKGIRAALGYDLESARSSRNDDDANVLCLPAHYLSPHEAEQIVDLWLQTHFDGAARFKRRIKELDSL